MLPLLSNVSNGFNSHGPLLSDSLSLLAAEAPVLRGADEPRRPVRHRPILPGPHHRRVTGQIDQSYAPCDDQKRPIDTLNVYSDLD